MDNYVKSDLTRYYGKCDFKTFLKAYRTNSTFRFQYAFRMCQSKGIKKKFGLFLWRINRMKKVYRFHMKLKLDTDYI